MQALKVFLLLFAFSSYAEYSRDNAMKCVEGAYFSSFKELLVKDKKEVSKKLIKLLKLCHDVDFKIDKFCKKATTGLCLMPKSEKENHRVYLYGEFFNFNKNELKQFINSTEVRDGELADISSMTINEVRKLKDCSQTIALRLLL